MKINSFLKKLISQALKEDNFKRDVTSQLLLAPSLKSKALISAKEDLVICGLPLAVEVFRQVDKGLRCKVLFKEGAKIKKNKVVLQVSGKARALLAGERVALNFLQRLSGIATLTHQYVEAVQGTGVKILDTRKTTPGLRLLERHAVKVGGGVNHRFDLSEAVMVKDNHRALAGSLKEISKKLKNAKVPVIVEVETLDEFKEALNLGLKYLQLDNMKLKELKRCVEWAKNSKKRGIKLEATGGVSLKNVLTVAKTGVDYISVGAITHSAPAVDLSMEIL